MAEGVTALLLFNWLLWVEWLRLVKELEAKTDPNPDPLVAEIRVARLRAGLPPEHDDT